MDVPEDIREKAQALVANAMGWQQDRVAMIAQALLSERLAQKERDAKIAETQADKPFAKHGKWHGTLRASIAAAIRQS
jgi:hypothetical protein